MYKPKFQRKRTGVPVLSKNDIDIIGEQFIADFCPQALKTPMAINIDGFAQSYLGLSQDFQYLSHNGIYLGMMVFNDTDKVPVYDPYTNRAEYISARGRTIIIDNSLLDEKQEHRYRFTMGHEAAHDIFHSGYYGYNQHQELLFDSSDSPMVQCRVESRNGNRRKMLWSDNDWMEWQANKLSSALLMPASMIRKLVTEHFEESPAFRAACIIVDVYRTFNVSMQAAEIRLQELGILDGLSKNDVDFELSLFAK